MARRSGPWVAPAVGLGLCALAACGGSAPVGDLTGGRDGGTEGAGGGSGADATIGQEGGDGALAGDDGGADTLSPDASHAADALVETSQEGTEASSEAGDAGNAATEASVDGSDAGEATPRADAGEAGPAPDAGDGGDTGSASDGAAVDGPVCYPGQVKCDGTLVICGIDQQWGTPSGCSCAYPQTCDLCTPGDAHCSGNGVEKCSSAGFWAPPATCVNQSCIAGRCSGICSPGQSRCADGGAGVETCESIGQWGAPIPCEGGSCVTDRCVANGDP